MSCYNQTCSSFTVQPAKNSAWLGQSTFARAIVVFIDAFHEALAMRRAAYRRYRLSDE
jgi:hypothetical protein